MKGTISKGRAERESGEGAVHERRGKITAGRGQDKRGD